MRRKPPIYSSTPENHQSAPGRSGSNAGGLKRCRLKVSGAQTSKTGHELPFRLSATWHSFVKHPRCCKTPRYTRLLLWPAQSLPWQAHVSSTSGSSTVCVEEFLNEVRIAWTCGYLGEWGGARCCLSRKQYPLFSKLCRREALYVNLYKEKKRKW